MPTSTPTPDTGVGGLLEGALNVLEALGGATGSKPREDGERPPSGDVIDVEAQVVSSEPVDDAPRAAPASEPAAQPQPGPSPAPRPAAPAPAPAVESRQSSGHAFPPSELAAPLYRLARGIELLNQDFTAARAAGHLGDRTATAWAGWRAELLEWGQRLLSGDWPRADEGGVTAGIRRRQAKLPRWRALLERESGQPAQHSRGAQSGTGTVAGVQTSAPKAAAPGLIESLPWYWKTAMAIGLAYGAVKVVPAIIDAIADPLPKPAGVKAGG